MPPKRIDPALAVFDEDVKRGWCHCQDCIDKHGPAGKYLSKTQIYKHVAAHKSALGLALPPTPSGQVVVPPQGALGVSGLQISYGSRSRTELPSAQRVQENPIPGGFGESNDMQIDSDNFFNGDNWYDGDRMDYTSNCGDSEVTPDGSGRELRDNSLRSDNQADNDMSEPDFAQPPHSEPDCGDKEPSHHHNEAEEEQDEEEREEQEEQEEEREQEEQEQEEEDNNHDEVGPICPVPPELEPGPDDSEDGNEQDPDVAALIEITTNSTRDNIETNGRFIEELSNASLSDHHHSNMTPEQLRSLRNPPSHININEVNDPDLSLSLQLYAILGDSADVTYRRVCAAITKRWPNANLLSHYLAKKKVDELTDVYAVEHDMCLNSCVAYTGPFRELKECPHCSTPCYDPLHPSKKKPQQTLRTIPLGPQLQALYRSPQACADMGYMGEKLQEISRDLQINRYVSSYDDFFCGKAFLDRFRSTDQELPKIKTNDPVLMFSIDGCQLYRNKESDCWIYIWVLFNQSPVKRYRKKYVMIGAIIPGPKKPINLDSFLFPGLHHLSALQRDGLAIWHAESHDFSVVHPFLALATADGPAMALLNGFVGYHGKMGCRFYCNFPGRHPVNVSHYYPVALKPNNYNVHGSDHGDISLRRPLISSVVQYRANLELVASTNSQAAYERERLASGISRGSIFSGLQQSRTLGVPFMFGSDIMHLCSLNIPDLLTTLWRGKMRSTGTDKASDWVFAVFRGPNGSIGSENWKEHGVEVAAATRYLPGSFDRPPRNPAEKINSGYKAWEFLLYIYGLGPALLFRWLPLPFWQNFCHLVYGVRIAQMYKIPSAMLVEGHEALVTFAEDFEKLYYERNPNRMHFVRPAIHSLLHLFPEARRVGPGICSSQWTMERTIGNLGREIRQPSNPFANLQQRGIRRAQINSLFHLYPSIDLNDDATLPFGAASLGDDYTLLRARDRSRYKFNEAENQCLNSFLMQQNLPPQDNHRIHRWARISIPTGQVARSVMAESKRPPEKTRQARNVKFIRGGVSHYAEVQYYFQYNVDVNGNNKMALAMVSKFTSLDCEMYELSKKTVLSYKYRGTQNLEIVPIKTIDSVVAMVPHQYTLGEVVRKDRFFVVEKPGLNCAQLGGANQDEMVEGDGEE